MEHLISELKDRLWDPEPHLTIQYLLPDNITKLTSAAWDAIKVEHGPVLHYPGRADAELESWKLVIQDKTIPANKTMLKTLDEAYQMFTSCQTSPS